MKKAILLTIIAIMTALPFPSKLAAYDPWCINFSCYGPCRPDCCGYGYEYCRRCPCIAPCCGTVVFIAAAVAAVVISNQHHRSHSHGHSHMHAE